MTKKPHLWLPYKFLPFKTFYIACGQENNGWLCVLCNYTTMLEKKSWCSSMFIKTVTVPQGNEDLMLPTREY